MPDKINAIINDLAKGIVEIIFKAFDATENKQILNKNRQ